MISVCAAAPAAIVPAAGFSRRMGRPAYDPYREGKREPVRAAA